ncbi:MAG: putative acetyltransferase [Holophagaceae bacterium]|nr:putative acetyltransferase [Holophagaceae bacterium]
MSIDILPIAEAHAEGFHACLDAVARERKYLALVEALPLDRLREVIRENVAHDAAQVVALDEGRVVGWCDIFPRWAPAVRHCGILGMGVLPAYRGRGIGRQLLAACIAKAFSQGITRIELEVRADNQRAIRLYERMGFVQEGRLRQAFRLDGASFDALLMSLLLD